MKKYLQIGVVCLSVLVFLFIIWGSVFGNRITSEPIIINESRVNPANCEQYQASIQMTTANGKLYFYYSENSSLYWDPNILAGYLCAFEDGTVHRINKMDASEYMVFHNGFVYYSSFTRDYRTTLRCYDLAGRSDKEVVETAWNSSCNMPNDKFYLSKDGILYIPMDSDRLSFVPISGTNAGKVTDQQESYQYGDFTYVVDHSGYGKSKVYVYRDQMLADDYSEYFEYGVDCVFACELGLIIKEWDRGYNLYYINGETGEITELFTAECARSVSAINIYQNDVYLSLLRYESYDVLDVKRYKNDTLEGTWRFNLETGKTQKVSDSIYNGIFIFDDTGMFVCDENRNIYKLDFDGNVIMTLLMH